MVHVFVRERQNLKSEWKKDYYTYRKPNIFVIHFQLFQESKLHSCKEEYSSYNSVIVIILKKEAIKYNYLECTVLELLKILESKRNYKRNYVSLQKEA